MRGASGRPAGSPGSCCVPHALPVHVVPGQPASLSWSGSPWGPVCSERLPRPPCSRSPRPHCSQEVSLTLGTPRSGQRPHRSCQGMCQPRSSTPCFGDSQRPNPRKTVSPWPGPDWPLGSLAHLCRDSSGHIRQGSRQTQQRMAFSPPLSARMKPMTPFLPEKQESSCQTRGSQCHAVLTPPRHTLPRTGAGTRTSPPFPKRLGQTPKMPEAEHKLPLLSSRRRINHAEQALSPVPKILPVC